MMDERKKKSLINIIVGIIFTLISIFFVISAIMDSGNSIVIAVTLVIGIGFLWYGKHAYKKAKKASKFEEWHG